MLCLERDFCTHLCLGVRCTSQEMFEVQLDPTLWSDRPEEPILVEAGLSQSAHKVADVKIAVAELSFQLGRTLSIHDVGIAKHLVIRS